MSNERNTLSSLFAACWKNDALKARFMEDPKAVLSEHGIDVAEHVSINVVENSDTCMNITIPSAPPRIRELSDADLMMVTGGGRRNAHGGGGGNAPWSMLGCVTKICEQFTFPV